MKCALCEKKAKDDSKLCDECDNDRMLSASIARIMAGTGLTWSNTEIYSEDNWISDRLSERKEGV